MRLTRNASPKDRLGFTMIELAIVIMVASILVGVAVPRIQTANQQRDVNGARDNVLLLAAVARASAMDRARTIQFTLNTTNGTAFVLDPTAADTIEILRFVAERGVSASASPSTITLCFTTRGYATTPCSTALSGPTTVNFTRGTLTASLEIWPLGQVRRL